MRDDSDLYYCEDEEGLSDPNDYSFSKYIQAHVVWGVAIGIVYWLNVFRCVPDCDLICSVMIMIGILIVTCMIGIFFQYKEKRTFHWMLSNLIIGFGFYTVVSYISVKTAFITVMLVGAGVFTLLNAAFLCIKRIKKKKKALRIIAGRIGRSFIGGWIVYGGAFTAMVLILIVSSFFGSSKVKTYSGKADTEIAEGLTIGNSMDVLVNLETDKWKALDQQQRLNVLKRVIDIECNNMGIDSNIPLYAEEMEEDRDVQAYYNEADGTITVNLDDLMNTDPYYLCKSMCHETRHAEQFIMISIYDAADESSKNNSFFDQTARMKKEFDDYVSGKDNFYAYYGQECERDARSYSESRVGIYFDALSVYLSDDTDHEAYKGYRRNVDEAGNWSIINGEGVEVFSGAEKINDLQEGLSEVTAVVEGRAVILTLPAENDDKVRIKKAFDAYRDITDIFCDCFAIVTDMEGNEGVVDLSGKVIIPSDYARIVYKENSATEDGRHEIQFSLRQSDQTGDIVTLELDPSDMSPWAESE